MANQRNYEVTNQLLLDSAKTAFLANGFKDTKLRDICRQANLTTGAFYKHFKSKDELLEKLVAPFLEELQASYLNQINPAIANMTAANLSELFLTKILNMDDLIHQIYQNPEIAELLLFKTNGSKYNNLAELITKFFADNIIRAIEAMLDQGFLAANFELNRRQIHFLVYSNTATFYDILKHSYSETETISLYQNLCNFNYYGWLDFLGIKK
ncbi:TetR/AcrR family transcriptional regulator [Fructilactobacillus vespulae]|uniref:TetR/AcrR family transcriptional regulator n=1 Tax=Fructilactobacillus vespulae TaxID=1249630 RepID=UPI0039B48633